MGAVFLTRLQRDYPRAEASFVGFKGLIQYFRILNLAASRVQLCAISKNIWRCAPGGNEFAVRTHFAECSRQILEVSMSTPVLKGDKAALREALVSAALSSAGPLTSNEERFHISALGGFVHIWT